MTTEITGTTKKGGVLRELPVLALIALVLAFLLRTFVVEAFWIPSESMVPTLMRGDRVLVNRFAYDVREPKRGEVVVFAGHGKDLIKRVIGLPGDQVAMRSGVVYVNGEPLREALAHDGGYLQARDPADFGPVTVAPHHFFMMGDNRTNSDDSRGTVGQVPADALIGPAFAVFWPPGDLATLPAPQY